MENKEIKDLIKVFDDSSLSEIKIKDESFSIHLSKQINSAPIATISAPAPVATPMVASSAPTLPAQSDTPVASNGLQVKSPMVGIYYSSANPNAKPFASAGDIIKKGKPLAIIEAMKIMNEIDAEYDMKILKVLVENGGAVEFDMALFEVEKA